MLMLQPRLFKMVSWYLCSIVYREGVYNALCGNKNIFCSTAIISDECLAILLKRVGAHFTLGNLLGIEDNTLKIIASYYNNDSEQIVRHIIRMWLMHDPRNPSEELIEALKDIGEHEIATQLMLLSCGKQVCNTAWRECENTMTYMYNKKVMAHSTVTLCIQS